MSTLFSVASRERLGTRVGAFEALKVLLINGWVFYISHHDYISNAEGIQLSMPVIFPKRLECGVQPMPLFAQWRRCSPCIGSCLVSRRLPLPHPPVVAIHDVRVQCIVITGKGIGTDGDKRHAVY